MKPLFKLFPDRLGSWCFSRSSDLGIRFANLKSCLWGYHVSFFLVKATASVWGLCRGFSSQKNNMTNWKGKQFHTCFFNLRTLNLSKSVNASLFSLCARRLAHVLSAHFDSTFSFSQAFATAPLPTPRGNFGITIGVIIRFESELAWRGTEAFSFFEGPSTRTYDRMLA